jgi:hypothetical protein
MSEHTSRSSYSTRNTWASGLMFFAAAVMVTVGFFEVLQSIAALAEDEFFVRGAEYVYTFDLTTWGWVHLLIGAALVAVGAFLFTGATWARWAGIGVAALCAVANFMWLPYYPFWALALIALNIAVIWALCVVEAVDEPH